MGWRKTKEIKEEQYMNMFSTPHIQKKTIEAVTKYCGNNEKCKPLHISKVSEQENKNAIMAIA